LLGPASAAGERGEQRTVHHRGTHGGKAVMSTEGEMKFAAALLMSPVSGPPVQMRSTMASICSASRTSQM
jgi:hypothetical protein